MHNFYVFNGIKVRLFLTINLGLKMITLFAKKQTKLDIWNTLLLGIKVNETDLYP